MPLKLSWSCLLPQAIICSHPCLQMLLSLFLAQGRQLFFLDAGMITQAVMRGVFFPDAARPCLVLGAASEGQQFPGYAPGAEDPKLMKSCCGGGTGNSKHRGLFIILLLVLLPVAEGTCSQTGMDDELC